MKTNLYIALLLPWLIAEFLSHHPLLSYLIAYGGSFIIFYLTIFSSWKCINPQQNLSEQAMQPIVLLQLIFAGIMCCTSIFHFLNHLGFHYFNRVRLFHVSDQTYLLAKCQRLALLAHIALVLGITLQIKRPSPNRYKLVWPMEKLLFRMSISLLLIILTLQQFPGMKQFSIYLTALNASAQIMLFIWGMRYRKLMYLCYGGVSFGILLLTASLSGYKEFVIVHIITFSFLALPYFKRIISLSFIPVILILLYFLPTFTAIMRTYSWKEKRSAQSARLIAYETLADEDNQLLIRNNNWEFMTMRLSEIGMFGKYLNAVPNQHRYYGTQILKSAILAIVPRALWPAKPDTEKVSMQRVYHARVVNPHSPVSAKTRPAIDGYLSAGLAGVFFSMLCYGLITQWLANKAEAIFGGYQLGCAIIFNSIFQQLWRGNNWEFLLNNIVYGTITMFMLFRLLIVLNILKPYNYDHDPAHHAIL